MKSDVIVLLQIFEIEEKWEQHMFIKFRFNSKQYASEAYNMTWEDFDECALSRVQVF